MECASERQDVCQPAGARRLIVLHHLGPRSRRIYDALLEQIGRGELKPGCALPPHKKLAEQFGVAPMTVRQVLGRLESEGLITRQVGRGTFVREQQTPDAVVVAPPGQRAQLVAQVQAQGATVIALSPDAVLDFLSKTPSVALVVVAVTADDAGALELIGTLTRRWPRLCVVAVVDDAAVLDPLRGRPACPVLVLLAPPHPDALRQVVRLSLAERATDPRHPYDDTEVRSLAFQAVLLDAVEHAIVATRPDGTILYWNKAAERLYGWSADEVIGQNVGRILVTATDIERGKRIMERLRAGETWSGEFTVVNRAGKRISALVTDAPVRAADGTLIGIIGVSVDLTERKRAEDDRLMLARLEAALATGQILDQLESASPTPGARLTAQSVLGPLYRGLEHTPIQ